MKCPHFSSKWTSELGMPSAKMSAAEEWRIWTKKNLRVWCPRSYRMCEKQKKIERTKKWKECTLINNLSNENCIDVLKTSQRATLDKKLLSCSSLGKPSQLILKSYSHAILAHVCFCNAACGWDFSKDWQGWRFTPLLAMLFYACLMGFNELGKG